MSQKQVGGITLPPVSAEFMQQMEQAFPAPTLEPGFDRDKALWAAAQHDVVKWIKHHGKTKQTTATGAVVRMGT